MINWEKIVLVETEKIINCTTETFSLYAEKKVESGDWDLLTHKFEDSIIYKSLNDMFLLNVEWTKTSLFNHIMSSINEGKTEWYCSNEEQAIQRGNKINQLYEKIKNNGFKTQDNLEYEEKDPLVLENMTSDDIYVSITRDGEFLFSGNGTHRLSIAKILGIKFIPVKIIKRHTDWEKFRKEVETMRINFWNGLTYQIPTHPDFYDLETMWSEKRYEIIKKNKFKESKTLVDIGSLFGNICYKGELDGLDCTAVENDKTYLYVMRKTHHGLKFRIFDDSFLNLDKRDYDIVVALNIFHHFLKNETDYNDLVDFLESITFKEMFIQLHETTESQMTQSYKNYNNREFLEFILRTTNKTQYQYVGEERQRKIYKIF